MYKKPKKYQEINLSEFTLFLSVMQNREAYESVLSIILDERDLELEDVKVERVVLNDRGKRAIRLDAWAVDTKKRQINTEMQNDTDSDDIPRRARFYQGLMDSPLLKSGKGTRYRDLPATIIIFITQEDIFGKDLAMYTFTEQCREFPELDLRDGTTKIFLNMKSRNGRPELISLLQYMKETDLRNPEMPVRDARIDRLDEIVTEVKESEEWEEVHMSIYSQAIEQGLRDGLEKGLEQGLKDGLEKGLEQGLEQGLIRGKQEDILDLLLDCGSVNEELQQKIMQETDTEILKKWLKSASRANSIEEFEAQFNH